MTIHISKPTLSFDQQLEMWRLEANVDGAPVYFQSRYELAESSEAFFCAFFLHAKAHKEVLHVEGSIDGKLAANMDALDSIAENYWGFQGPEPEVTISDDAQRTAGTGLFFTCGVDSFYTLKRNLEDLQHLINVHGFDIRLSDIRRYEDSLVGLKQTAADLDLNLIQVRTNLRQHPLFKRLNWEITHGAALASVAHTLRKHLGRVRIAGTDVAPPWGSNPDLDKLWSGSAIELINDEIGIKRIDKVRSISEFEPSYRSLKVCWENLSESLNCGVCEKCVRTQTSIFAVGAKDRYVSFPPGKLVDRIGGLRSVHSPLLKQWNDLEQIISDAPTKRAIRHLILRSKVTNALRKTAIRLGAKKVMGLLPGRRAKSPTGRKH